MAHSPAPDDRYRRYTSKPTRPFFLVSSLTSTAAFFSASLFVAFTAAPFAAPFPDIDWHSVS